MGNTGFKLFNSNGTALALFGILSMFGMAGPANAETGCVTGPNDPSAYTLLIDASSTCSNLSANMFGCEVQPGANGCTILNTITKESFRVTLDSGTVGGITPIDWSVLDPTGPLVDLTILVGATNGGSCGVLYPPGSNFGQGIIFQKSESPVRYQKVNRLYFCSDFFQPAPDVPRLILTKTVTTEDDDTCSSSVDALDVRPGDDVRYCYTVENVGAGLAEDVILIDDNATPGDLEDYTEVTLIGLINGDTDLPSDGIATGMSGLVTIAKLGTVINTAEAVAFGPGGTVQVTATDTATVNAVQVADLCPDDFQQTINDLSKSTGLDFALLMDPHEGGRHSVCTPNGKNGAGITKKYRCINQCVTKTICKTDPNNLACKPSVCEGSGAWTDWTSVVDVASTCSEITNPPPGLAPYCFEIQQDLDANCTINTWSPQETTVIEIKKGHVNPYVWEVDTTDTFGRADKIMYCYFFPGEDASACPRDSTVVN